MDAELKTWLEGMESRIQQQIKTEVGGMADHLLFEMEKRFAEADTKLTSIDARLKLQAGLIQGGARAMARFSAFAEDSETRWVDLVARVRALERKTGLDATDQETDGR